MKASVVTCVLLAVWPVLNFLAHNKKESLDLQLLLTVALLQIVGAVAIGGAIRLLLFRRARFDRTLPAAGLAMAFFLSYNVVEKLYRALSVPPGTQLYAWLVLWILVIAAALWAFRTERGRSAACVTACVLVVIPLVDFTYYRLTHSARGVAGTGRTDTAAQKEHSTGAMAGQHTPNVYFFILDMYSRADSLKQYYNHDNSDFLHFLEGKGFHIASNSFSNYPATETSVPTTLNMDYFLPIVNEEKLAPKARPAATPLVRGGAYHVDTSASALTAGTYGWRAYGNNAVERDGDALRIKRVGGSDSDKGAHFYMNPPPYLLEPLVVGDSYRLKITARVSAGANIGIALAGNGISGDANVTSSTYQTYSIDFTPTARTGHFICFPRMEPGQSIWLKEVEIEHFGSRATQTLADTQIPTTFDRNILNTYLGSYQHLSPVLSTFRKLGYRVLFANLAGTKTEACDPYCIEGQQNLSFQQVEILGMTPIREALRRYRPDIWRNVTTFYQKDPLDVVRKIPADVPQPFFLFAHILSPHPPYIYTADCELRDEYSFELDPTVAVFKDRGEMFDLYRAQLTCVDSLMTKAVDHILARDPDALVIIQGDHGLGKLPDGMPRQDQLRSRYGILNAFRVPEGCRSYVYDTITPVNTFRLVFGCLGGSEPVFVPDRMFEQFEESEYFREIDKGSLSPSAVRQ